MAQHLQQGQPLDAVALQQMARRAGLLLEECRQQFPPADVLATRAEGVNQGALHHSNEAKCAVGLEGLTVGHGLEGVAQHGLQIGAQGVQLHAAALQGPGGVGIVQQGQQQVFQGHILMAASLGQLKGPLETLVQFGAQLRRIRHLRPPP